MCPVANPMGDDAAICQRRYMATTGARPPKGARNLELECRSWSAPTLWCFANVTRGGRFLFRDTTVAECVHSITASSNCGTPKHVRAACVHQRQRPGCGWWERPHLAVERPSRTRGWGINGTIDRGRQRRYDGGEPADGLICRRLIYDPSEWQIEEDEAISRMKTDVSPT